MVGHHSGNRDPLLRNSLGSSGENSVLSLLRAWAQSLVRELQPCKLRG